MLKEERYKVLNVCVFRTIPISFRSLVWNIRLFFTETSNFLVLASSSGTEKSNLSTYIRLVYKYLQVFTNSATNPV